VFDAGTGLGQVATPDGCAVPFHCTEIADGSRSIEVGTAVEFSAVAGHLGRWEARRLRALGPPAP